MIGEIRSQSIFELKKSESSKTLRTGAKTTHDIRASIILSSAGSLNFLKIPCNTTTESRIVEA
jgi:hypothetical protein